MDRGPQIAGKGRTHIHLPTQRELAEVGVAHAREIRRREARQRGGLRSPNNP